MIKSAYYVFMTTYRHIIKSILEEVKNINNRFILSDDDAKQLEALNKKLTIYHARFNFFTRSNSSKTAFIKIFDWLFRDSMIN